MLLEISSENGQSIAYPSRDYPKPNGEMHRKGKNCFSVGLHIRDMAIMFMARIYHSTVEP